jgi:S-formylglutathione hydrolase FrmB
MQRCPKLLMIALTLALLVLDTPAQNASSSPLRFRITLAKEIAPRGVSGRLLVLMTDSVHQRDSLNPGFVPGSMWMAAMEVEQLAPGGSIDLDADRIAFPGPLSQAKRGTYQVMALLDPNHSYPYHGQDEGDFSSQVIKIEDLNPADSKPVELTLSRITPAGGPSLTDTDQVKLVEFESPLLSTFWGRSITMRAGVVLPPSYTKATARTYPAAYHIHGFGGDHRAAWRQGQSLVMAMADGKQPEMIHVFLDGSFPTGHHEFADSVNNGPWGRALTEEFIPLLEKRFRLVAKPYARFLTGHSSGGWSTLWLQVTYPDFFGGTWSTAPDPVDFREFTGINATAGSTDNAYRKRDGAAKNLVRMNGKEIASVEEFARQEEVMGEYGGQFASFEWVFSPRGQDGRPLKLFNRVTGDLNQDVVRAWEKYDIRLTLDRTWATLGPKLRGKLNLFCGDADTFHLNEAFKLLCDFLKRKGSDAVCELVPGRDHMNLYQAYQTYPEGLALRVYKEMYAKFEKESSAAGQRQ